MRQLQAGKNKIELNFTCQDKALNRNKDYVYTLFVPDLARSVFPCFDQPDLRAVFVTTLHTPSGWKTMTSDNSCQLPTYLYSFVAGNFQEKTGTRNGRLMRALYRERSPNSTRYSMRQARPWNGWKAIRLSLVLSKNMVWSFCLTTNLAAWSILVLSNSATAASSLRRMPHRRKNYIAQNWSPMRLLISGLAISSP